MHPQISHINSFFFLFPSKHCKQASQGRTKLFITPGTKKRVKAKQMELKGNVAFHVSQLLFQLKMFVSQVSYKYPTYSLNTLCYHLHFITTRKYKLTFTSRENELDVFMNSANELKTETRPKIDNVQLLHTIIHQSALQLTIFMPTFKQVFIQ